MESREIFEESLDELARIKKDTSAAVFSINTEKLDSVTKGELLSAIRNVANQRTKDINHILNGVH